jgi:hypothetical protein
VTALDPATEMAPQAVDSMLMILPLMHALGACPYSERARQLRYRPAYRAGRQAAVPAYRRAGEDNAREVIAALPARRQSKAPVTYTWARQTPKGSTTQLEPGVRRGTNGPPALHGKPTV